MNFRNTHNPHVQNLNFTKNDVIETVYCYVSDTIKRNQYLRVEEISYLQMTCYII